MANNVVDLPVITSLPLDPQRVLAKASEAGLAGVVIVGEFEDGRRYFASSISDGPEVLWLLSKAQRDLLAIVEDNHG